MEYMSVKEIADKWGISQRRVSVLCSGNHIPAAKKVGNMWIVPANAQKPTDARHTRYDERSEKKLKPFLKWAGGKGQLLPEIEKYYPFEDKNIKKYAEPFVGGGAVLFDILEKYNLKSVYISLKNVSDKLQCVEIVCGDYKLSESFIDNHTSVYFDPPYRPLTETASFTAYTENSFDDAAQIELSEFAEKVDTKGARVVVREENKNEVFCYH